MLGTVALRVSFSAVNSGFPQSYAVGAGVFTVGRGRCEVMYDGVRYSMWCNRPDEYSIETSQFRAKAWDDYATQQTVFEFEERGARASEYVSVGVPRNLVPREDVVADTGSVWTIRSGVEGVNHFDRSLGQPELVKLTSPAVGRDKRLLLCT